jgi:RNA polymerase sigma-54 factor
MIKLNKKVAQGQRNQLSFESKLFIRLINLDLNQIDEYIEKELIENPCLEESELYDADKLRIDTHTKDYSENLLNVDALEDRSKNLIEYLARQLNLFEISREEKKIISSIIHLLDERGFILSTNLEILSSLEDKKILGLNEISIEELIRKAQRFFDPPGVFSRSLQECLKIQLELSNNPNKDVFFRIIDNHFEDLARKDFKDISKNLGVDQAIVKKCLVDLSELSFNPADIFPEIETSINFTEPEAYVYEQNNKLIIQLNRSSKKIKVSDYYKKMIKLEKDQNSEVFLYLKDKLKSATVMIKTIIEREQMYENVIKSIIEVQKDYILKGERYLNPLKLSDIAVKVNVHESTISRITRNKYISTPRGTLNMKSFFSNKVKSEDSNSSIAVRDMIDELITKENKKSPLSDLDIKKELDQKGVNIARRTIAKYRNILKISSSIKRRVK